MGGRFLRFEDLFETTTKCKKCGSINTGVSILECGTCGLEEEGKCNDCGSKFKYHEFKTEEGEYVNGKWIPSTKRVRE